MLSSLDGVLLSLLLEGGSSLEAGLFPGCWRAALCWKVGSIFSFLLEGGAHFPLVEGGGSVLPSCWKGVPLFHFCGGGGTSESRCEQRVLSFPSVVGRSFFLRSCLPFRGRVAFCFDRGGGAFSVWTGFTVSSGLMVGEEHSGKLL